MERDIVQNLISRLGQSQDERTPPELLPDFAPVDGRTTEDRIALTRLLVKHLNYYRQDPENPAGRWDDFFPDTVTSELFRREDGKVPPHLALFGTFLELYEYPRALANSITARHLDFQYRRVLGFVPRPPIADRAHLLVELKKGAAPVAIRTNQQFAAGKDATKVELVYQPVRETVINHAAVSALRSVYLRDRVLYFAPIANSSDGLGGALDVAQPRWRPFGHSELPVARPGFAFSSPLLRLSEGDRIVTLELTLGNLVPSVHTQSALEGAFEAYLTGPAGWLGPFALTATLSGNHLALTITLPATELAVTDYAPAVHGQSYAATSPIVLVQLRSEGTLRYGDLAELTLGATRLAVSVTGMKTTLVLENDNGALNPKRAFQPFGAQPKAGSRFLIGCPEALSKPLQSLEIRLTWQAAPADLYAWYTGYSQRARMSNGVSATLTYQDRTGQVKSITLDLMARAGGVSVLSPESPSPAPNVSSLGAQLYSLSNAGSGSARQLAYRFTLAQPIFLGSAAPPEARSGFVTVELVDDFLHADYRKETVQNALAQSLTVLNEPYTPTVHAISLSYQARSDEVDVSLDSADSFGNLDLQFHHAGCFGQMREHAFLRGLVDFLGDTRVTLLPAYLDEGELLIGVSGVGAGDSLSLLLEAADGSGDPELAPVTVGWSVLSDNYWRPLTPSELALDTTDSLRVSGIVGLTLPKGTTTEHTLMPKGMVWLRATAHERSASASQLLSVATNAIEVVFVDQTNDPAHLSAALPSGTIAKLKDKDPAVKSVSQPYPSFGGRMAETDDQLRRRASERLRHRNRCITAWDYERVVLEAFPSLHKVKCIPHASPTSWFAPGHVMVVVIPDLTNQNALNPLEPRADVETLVRVEELLRARSAMQVEVLVKNPFYQRVRVDFRVRLLPGYAFNYYRGQIEQALMQALAPWAFDAARIEFGGRIYRSVLLDLVEELPYVDFVTDFRLQTILAEGSLSPDLSEVSAATPDAILVSDASHSISELATA